MNISGRFQVRETFVLKERGYFVLLGDVVDGVIKAGMEILIPFNSALSMDATIHSIESVKSAKSSSDVKLGLTIKCASVDELSAWTSLGIKNEVLDIRSKNTP